MPPFSHHEQKDKEQNLSSSEILDLAVFYPDPISHFSMKLVKAQVKNFRSIEDSGVFEIADLCCLVGKNEAGKSALLDALYGVNPYRKYDYEKTRDYPRRFLAKYDLRHPDGNSEVAKTWWKLDQQDVALLIGEFGDGILTSEIVCVTSYIGRGNTWIIDLDEKKFVEREISKLKLNASEKSQVKDIATTAQFAKKVGEISGASEKLLQLKKRFDKYREGRAILKSIDILHSRMPKFFLTSHFDRMSGEVSLKHLKECRQNDTITPGDRIFLDFIEYAGTSLEDLEDSTKYEELKALCEAASNDITDEIFQFWSQNDAISVKIDIGEGKPHDPPPFNNGTIAKIRIWNDNHRASIPLSERSAGFVWFFSFLSQFKQLAKTAGDVVLLLDEPGLTLHGKAQSDLLEYIKSRLLNKHQVIYTTHSPFLVPAHQLDSVRVVEDVVERFDNGKRPEIKGTKVSSEVLNVNKDTLFPLRGHLGYEISQSLFIGENTLLVEGPSDILYIQAVSDALKSRKREYLNEKWVICPSGGVDKVSAFVSLFSGNKLNVAVLTDFANGDKGKINRLRESQIMATSQIFTTSDFVDKNESDVEDLFSPSLYLKIVNSAFGLDPKIWINETALNEISGERIVKKVEAIFRTLPNTVENFGHFAPATYLLRHPEILEGDDPEILTTLETFERVFKVLNKLI